ncbi:hypothetical protein RM531_01905 [Salinisphaera sp. P385]|uniref:Uncharacterized protein n=1 Tax=Spectribacter acetivorans TaxID=3075603 RepID=A0ABU3B5W4_9GAMM|nr:hypothetical protein [Salinisphaera sp. P385]MDT0617222.1 hypothetical protein [Salinisphaera sp. P385]
MGDRLDQLRAEIPMNVDVQRFFDGLDEGDREQLAGLIGEAVARQEARIDEAGEDALRLVPRAFRGPVKKLLFGDHD